MRDEGGLEDRVSVGVLARAFPRHEVEAVVDAAGVREQRRRLLPAWLVVYYVLGLALFMDMGGPRVMRKLVGTLAWAARGVTVRLPSEEALSKARMRLGPAPLRLLFERVAAPLAAPGALWRGRRVWSMDGTTFDVQDTEANWARFGGPATKDAAGKTLRGAFPQLRLVGLAECATRAIFAAALGGYEVGEQTLARGLLGRLHAGVLLLADRGFPSYELWQAAAATGADLLWRVSASFTLPVDEVLPDGTYLSRLRPPAKLRRAGATDIVVRVVEYQLENEAGEPTEVFALITTLLDPGQAPAVELAGLYHARWEFENALGALKTGLRGARTVLRSKTPGGAEQEVWALLCAYHAVRDIICAAASLAQRDPLRISFAAALDAVRAPVGDPGLFPPADPAR